MITDLLMMIIVAQPGQFQAEGAKQSPNPAHDKIPHHILLTTHYPLSNYSLLTTASPLSFKFRSRRLPIHYPQLTLVFYSTTTHYASPITCYARPITRYPLPITHWPLLTSPCSPFLHCSFQQTFLRRHVRRWRLQKDFLRSAPPRPPLPGRGVSGSGKPSGSGKFFYFYCFVCVF